MPDPLISFVVPCYKLAHLLPECVASILAQSYSNFEILIMDDCSPDETPQVSKSFRDARVKYERNESNLGHLRNYNKGIQLSKGKYVWLISADDYLRRPYILERYVRLMELHPNVGYSFCPGVGVKNGQETEVLDYSVCKEHDCIIDGREFLEVLVNQNIVIAASALARRECYENISLFPLDATWAGERVEMGWAGDWYLWCMFALPFDVAYFSEPMVCYREHDLNMTAIITDKEKVRHCAAADIAIPWMIKRNADQRKLPRLAKRCLSAVANEYVRQARSKRYRSGEMFMTLDEFEESIGQSTEDEAERTWLRARFLLGLGDRFWRQGDSRGARVCYWSAMQSDPRLAKAYAKLLLVLLGKFGTTMRRAAHDFRAARNLADRT